MTINDFKKEISNWKFTKHKATWLTIGLIALLFYEFVARPYYRPYIYRNNINDFHLADTIGNSLGTIATIFLFLFLFGGEKKRDHFLIKTVTLSLVVYELAHPLLGKSIDPWDIAATLVTGVCCFVLHWSVHRRNEPT
jgi:hypothetical protein